jgi:hypothetical protein
MVGKVLCLFDLRQDERLEHARRGRAGETRRRGGAEEAEDDEPAV